MGAHEVGTLAALKAVPIRGAAPPRGQASSTARLATAQLFVCSLQKSFGKAAWSRQVTQEKWYAPLRQSGSLRRTTSFLSCFQSAKAIEKHMKDYVRGPTEAR